VKAVTILRMNIRFHVYSKKCRSPPTLRDRSPLWVLRPACQNVP